MYRLLLKIIVGLSFVLFTQFLRAEGEVIPDSMQMLASLEDEVLADRLEMGLSQARSRVIGASDNLPALIAELTRRGVPQSKKERAQLSRAWKAAAFLVLETEGHTLQLVETLEIASAMDPDDKALAREAAFQRRRQEIAQRRLERAAEVRATREGSKKEKEETQR